MSDWISTGGDYLDGLPKLTFPLNAELSEIYVPERTFLRMSNDSRTHAWLWCYLERMKSGKRHLFKPSSLSERRVKDLPRTIERLSTYFHFNNARPRTVDTNLRFLTSFMNWLDAPLHQGRYESILSNQDLAFEALKKHHTHLRQRMQANDTGKTRFSSRAASLQDVGAIKLMSVIHEREYSNEIEAIKFGPGEGVKAPKTEDVAAFMACAQGIFDSVTRIALDDPLNKIGGGPIGELRWQSGGQERSIPIPQSAHVELLMELGCIAYAALCIGDSGANLSQIQTFEEPEDLHEQLDNPDRLNLRHKVIKFRAGGKEVPIHLTATTVTRMRHYLRVREALRLRLGCHDISPMFIQCKYARSNSGKPLDIVPLENSFTWAVRFKFRKFGIELPSVTMQQLRAYKQGKLARAHSLEVVAGMMGTTVSTAIKSYCKIAETESRSEMAPFLASLTSVVVTRSKANERDSKPTAPLTSIPSGGCADHGHPKPLANNPLVEPDCKRTEGCFFCDKYHVHADENDAIKLMSCHSVLERLPQSAAGSDAAERVYGAVINRIGALLGEIKRISPDAHERARRAVQQEGKLTRYWAGKLQQLHLLGLLVPPPSDG